MNLAEIRKKAQQAKDAQQESPAEQEQPLVEHEQPFVETMEYLDDYSDEAGFMVPANADEEDIDGDDEPWGERGRGLPDATDFSPEDIFPEPMEVMLDTPEIPALELITGAVQAKPVPPVPVVEEEAVSRFDPVSVLLKGREKAGCDEDAFIGPSGSGETSDSESQEFLCFRVSSEEYALNIMEIKEIIKPREVTEVPRVPAFVSGVLSLRGIIIPIFDMNMRLGLPKSESGGKERIIVVRHGAEGFCGILVDEVVQVVRIENRLLEPPPTVLEGIDRDFVNGIGRFTGRMLILLNMEKILDITLF